jgi:HEAT repeat protein
MSGQTNAHTLQEWVEILGAHKGSTDYTNAQLAIRFLGTNAIPPLLTWLSFNPPDRGYYPSLSNPSPADLDDSRRFALANAAVDTFRVLGPIGAPALPALSNLAMAGGRHSAARAVQAMGNIGPIALPALMGVLTNGPESVGWSVPFAMCGFGTNAKPAIPVLILCLTNTALREPTLRTLSYLAANGMERDLILPAIFRLISYPDSKARTSAMNMLPLFGQDAREALPQLVTALSDPDTDVRTTAAEALKQIAPEVLTNSAAR